MPRRPHACLGAGLGAAVTTLVVAAAGVAAAAGPLVPGSEWSTTVDLPDAWAAQADRLGVAVSSLAQRENGCVRPEVAAGDTTCDADGGDLAGLVSATVAAGRYAGEACVALTRDGDLDLLSGQPTRIDLTGPECVVLTIRFPESPVDDTAQSDDLTVALSLVAGGPGEEVQPAAPEVVRADVADEPFGAGAATQAPTGPTGTTATVPAPGSGAGAADSSGAVVDRTLAGSGVARIGEATAEVTVGAGDTVVEAESSDRLLDDPFALGALLLGTTVLLWVLFLLLRRRRGEPA